MIETSGTEVFGSATGAGGELTIIYLTAFRYYSGVRRTLLATLLPLAAEAGPTKTPVTAAVNRCATRNQLQNQMQNQLLPHRLTRWPDAKPRFLVVYLTLLIGSLAGLNGCYSGNHPGRIGTSAPDFTVQDSDHKVTLSQYRGQVVVLNFWATWCAPCIDETPSLVKMQTHLKDKGVVVLAVSIDADDAAYHKFLKDYSVNMITVRDEARKASSLYGTFGWPESYIIDRNGVIRRKFIGAVDWTSPEIVEYLTKL
jgi:cytochrome c biogenesis protein CcmG/thiol:disulfide interchange protein DsbE